jgi:hypothetical protein
MIIYYDAENMGFACMISKARTRTHSECLISIAFTKQQPFRESASILRYKYITGLAMFWMELRTNSDDFSILVT